MKHFAFVAWLLAASVALAGSVCVFEQVQIGNGTNGMTYAPAAGDGCPVLTSGFGGVAKNYADLSIAGTGTNTFLNASDISWLRCQHFVCDPNAAINSDGTCTPSVIARCPAFDIEVDGGQGGKNIALNVNRLYYNVGPLPLSGVKGERYTWTGENLQQSGTLDAGVGIVVKLVTE